MMGLVGVSFSPIGRAIGRLLSGTKDADVEGEIEALRGEIADLRAELEARDARTLGQVEEIHGRLDFAERMLAQGREKGALGSGGA